MSAAQTEPEVLLPRDLAQALGWMRQAQAQGQPLVPLAGGTDLMVNLHFRTLTARRFINLWGLSELGGIDERDGVLRLGALTTYTGCIRSALVARHLPILIQAAREVGGVQIQNRGTLAGNIANASPAGDAIPVLMAADAELVLTSAAGERCVPLRVFYTGYRTSVRQPDELITAIRVPVPAHGEPQYFRKVGTRAAQAISKVVVAAVGSKIALGSVAPTVVRAIHVEAYRQGGGHDLEQAKRLLEQDIQPIDDIRSTAAYRLRVAKNLLGEIWQRLG